MLRCKRTIYGLLWYTCVAFGAAAPAGAQTVHVDSVIVPPPPMTHNDSVFKVKPHRDPHKATIRSAVLPGWGQYYNHKYWKIPLVYGALITCGAIFNYNLHEYKFFRHIYQIVGSGDTAQFKTIPSIYYTDFSPSDIQYARNEARQYVDYSVLSFIILWGLNVVDATVDAHLHEFDVTDKLTLRISPESGLTGGATGISLVLEMHPPKRKHSALY